MFDFERFKVIVAEHYFKVFQLYNKPEQMGFFIRRWCELIHTYSKSKGFISFDPTVPVLSKLVPGAKAILMVPFPNTRINYLPRRTSVFPYYPFKVKKEIKDETCQIGLEFFHLYLELTGIRIVCIYDMRYQEDKIASELQDTYPDIELYGRGAYSSFRSKVQSISSKSLSGGSKFQSHLKGSRDRVSQ